MDLERIERLLGLLEDRGVNEFLYEDSDIKLRLRLGEQAPVYAPAQMMAPAPVHAAATPAAAPVAAAAAPAANSNLGTVESPMVGTFYTAPAPDAKSYCEVGDRVSKGQVLCIVEAMKLMNEIESEVAGVVTEVLVANGDAVQFGQALFLIDPA